MSDSWPDDIRGVLNIGTHRCHEYLVYVMLIHNIMIDLNWKLLWKKTKLEKFDVAVCMVFAAIISVLVFVASLTGSGGPYAVKQTLGTSINGSVSNVLHWLESFEKANSFVTFLFWGAVGLVLYIIISSLLSMSKEVAYEQDLGSDDYVHPAAKTSKDIIVAEITNAGMLAIGLIGLVFSFGLVAFGILPTLIVNSRAFALQPTLNNGVGLAAATVVIAAGLCLVWFVARLCMHRRVILDA